MKSPALEIFWKLCKNGKGKARRPSWENGAAGLLEEGAEGIKKAALQGGDPAGALFCPHPREAAMSNRGDFDHRQRRAKGTMGIMQEQGGIVKEKISREGRLLIWQAQARLEAKRLERKKALGQGAAIRPAGDLAREAMRGIQGRVIWLAVGGGEGKPLVWRTAEDAIAEGITFSGGGRQ